MSSVIFDIQLLGTKRLEQLINFCSAKKVVEINKKKLINRIYTHQSDSDFIAILKLFTKIYREDNPSKLSETLIIIHVHNGIYSFISLKTKI